MRLHGEAGADEKAAVLTCGDAKSVTAKRTIVLGIARERRFVDSRPAVVIETEHGEVATEDLETGPDVTHLGRHDHADISRCLAHREGANSIRTAKREFLGRGEVARRALA